MRWYLFLIIAALLVVAELVYFKIADKLADKRTLPVAARTVQNDARLSAQKTGKKVLADFPPVVELVARGKLEIVERVFHAR